MGNKRLAVVAGGWHYPLQFYQEMARQKIPPGWDVDFFCVGHRPAPGKPDEKDALGIWDKDKIGLFLYDLDRILYGQFADLNALESLGWFYSLEPNTMGDYGFTNQ
jgi:hypothetical protein